MCALCPVKPKSSCRPNYPARHSIKRAALILFLILFQAGCGDSGNISIRWSNFSPTISSAPRTEAVAGEPYTYNVKALDSDGDALQYSLTAVPEGMEIDTAGVITWTPVFSQVGQQNVEVHVSDGRGGTVSQAYTLEVQAAEDKVPPFVELLIPQEVVVGGTLVVSATASDNVGIEKVSFFLDGILGGDVTAPPYSFDFNTPATGGLVLTVRAVAFDAAGNTSADEAMVSVVSTPDVTPPVITSITAPPSAAAGESVFINIDVSDERGVATVQIQFDGSVIATLPTFPYETSLQIPLDAIAGSERSYTVIAQDSSGNTVTAVMSITIDQTPDTSPPTQVMVQAPATARPGQTIRITASAADDIGVFKLVFLANDVRFDESTVPPYEAELPVPSTQLPGSQILVTVIASDFRGNTATSQAAIIQVLEAGESQIIGEVFDDATGLPLEGAVVQVTPLGSIIAEAQLLSVTTDTRGRFGTSHPEGEVIISVHREGYTSVTRLSTQLAGVIHKTFDFRMTPAAPAVSVDPRTGARLAVDTLNAETQIPVGTVLSTVDIHVTALSGQGLPALLPPGWSPIAAFHLGPEDIVFNNPVTALFEGIGIDLIAAQWDSTTRTWIRRDLVIVDGHQELMLARPGTVALLRPDTSPIAPPISDIGSAIEGVVLAPVPLGASAQISPDPDVLFMQPGARAEVQVTLDSPSPLSSGTPVVVDFTEFYLRTDGSTLVPEVTRQDIVLYQTGNGLVGQFIASPSQLFDPAFLVEGVIHLDVQSDGDIGPNVLMGSNGGTISGDNGIILNVPVGALAMNTAVTLSALNEIPLGLVSSADYDFLAGVEIGLGAELLATSAKLTLPTEAGIAAGTRVLAVRVAQVSDTSRLELVGIGLVVDNAVEIGSGALGLPLQGIDRSGRYFLLLSRVALGYATGLVSDDVVEVGPVVAEADTAPFVSLVHGMAEPYVLALPVGQSLVQALDLDSGKKAADGAAISELDETLVVDLQLGDVRPTVVQVTPFDSAIGVATTSSVRVRFSRWMDDSTISASSITLSAGMAAVAGKVALLSDGVTAVFQPDKPLANETLYTLILATGIIDSFGKPLLGNQADNSYATSFTTVDLSAPAPPEAGQISSSPPDDSGISLIEGTQGAVEPGTVVTVRNLATNVAVSTLGLVDGSFSLGVQTGLLDELEMLLIDPAGNQTAVELGRVTPPLGTGVIGPDGSTIQNEAGQALLIPPGAVPADTIISITPLELDGVVLPFSDIAPGTVGGAVTVSMPGVELAGVMELQLSLEGIPGSTITDLVPLYAIETEIQLPADLLPGTELTLRVMARDKLGEQTELLVPLPIVAANPDTTPRTEIINETPVVSLTLPTQAIPGQIIQVVARAQPPDIKVRFPADEALTGNEQLIVYELREIAGQTFLDLADTASFKILADGSRIIETNSPPYRGIRRDISQLILAVYTNEIISFAQVISDVSGLSGGGLAGAAVALSGSMIEQFNETIVGVSMIQAFSRPRPADVSLYEFAVVPVIGNTPTSITLVDLETNNVLAEAQLAALPPGTFSSVVIMGEDENDPVVTGTTSFKNDAVPLDAGIDIIFSHKVDTGSLAANLYIKDANGEKIEVNLIYLSTNNKTFAVKVVPQESLQAGEHYELIAGTGIKRPDGQTLRAQFTMAFTAGGSGELLGSLAINEADSFDVIGTTAVVTARSVDGTTNSLFTVDLSDPAKPVVLAERKLDFKINGGLRAVRAVQDIELVKRDGGMFRGDLAIVSIGSTDTFSAIRLYDITDPNDPTFLSGNLVGTPTQVIQDSANIVVIPNYDDFTDTEVYDPSLGLLDGIPQVQTIPWMIDTGGTGTAWFINNGIGLMTLDMGRAIPPPPRDERGSQLGPSYPPVNKSGALVIVDDPALVKDDGNFKFTQPSALTIIDGEKIQLGGTIDQAESNLVARSIARILVNGFEAPIQRNDEGEPKSFGTDNEVIWKIPLHEGYNIIAATAYDKAGVPLGSLQLAAGRKYSSNPLDQSGEVHTSLEPIQIRATTVTLTASVDDPVRFDEIFVNGESVSRKECPINVNQRTNACGWNGKGDITVSLQAGANTIMATAIDVDQNPFEENNDREFIGLSFYDLRVADDVAAAVNSAGLHLFQASSLARIKLLDIPNAFRLTLAPQTLTDKDKDGRMGIPENDDGDSITAFDELRNLALVGTGNLGKLVFADITEPHKAEVVGSIDFTKLKGNVKAGAVYRAAIDPEGVLAYVAAGDRIITVDISQPEKDTTGDSDARALGVLPLDDNGDLMTLPGARDVRLDPEHGVLYVLQKDIGLAVVAINVCSRDVGVDATRRPATRVSQFATLGAERSALRQGIQIGLATTECTDIFPDPADIALLSQGSSACLWREDGVCSSAYQPGLSDHDFELIVDDSNFDNADKCLVKIEEKIKEQPVMKNVDLSVFKVRRSAFTYAYNSVSQSPIDPSDPGGPTSCGAGDDPTGDLCLGRNGLMLKWLLEGEWVTVDERALDGGIDLEEVLDLLRSPITNVSDKLDDEGVITAILSGIGQLKDPQPTHIPRVEASEWACLQDFALRSSGARIRIKDTGIGNVDIQVPAFRKQIQKAAKAGIRTVFARMLASEKGNIWASMSSRADYNSSTGCFTAIDDPDKASKSILAGDFSYKRCESFEEYVASKALLSVARSMGILNTQDALLAYEFFRRKADVGNQIKDELEANKFIREAIKFIADTRKNDSEAEKARTETFRDFADKEARANNFFECLTQHIPSVSPPEDLDQNPESGSKFFLKLPIRLYNGGYSTIPTTELAIYHDSDTEIGTWEWNEQNKKYIEKVRPAVAPLAPGASRFRTMNIKATGDGEAHAVQLRLDPADHLVEYDKENNFDGVWYYYLTDPPATTTEPPATPSTPRPEVPLALKLPEPPASQQCLVLNENDEEEAPGSPSLELITTVDGQQDYTGLPGDIVTLQWIVRNTGNETLRNVKIYNPLLGGDNPVTISVLCSASDMDCLGNGGNTEHVHTKNNVSVPPTDPVTISISTVTAEDSDMISLGVISESARIRILDPVQDPKLEPVIFIPGISGSILKLGSREHWVDPSATAPINPFHELRKKQLTLNREDKQHYKGDSIKATDIIRTTAGSDVYKPLIDYLKTQGYTSEHNYGIAGCTPSAIGDDTKLFVFPYDWRKSNIDHGNLLNDYVQCIRSVHGDDVRISIIAHSMGGLLTMRYIRDYDLGKELSKVITIGSPWLGSPKAILTMGTGQFMDGSWLEQVAFQNFVITNDLLKKLVEYFPGVHQILPSRKYFEISGNQKAGWPFVTPNIDRVTDPILGCVDKPSAVCAYFNFVDVFDIALFPHSRPLRLQNEPIHGNGQDDWFGNPPRPSFYHVYGNGKLTIKKVTLAKDVVTNFQRVHGPELGINPGVGLNQSNIPVSAGGVLTWKKSIEFKPEADKSGDGTVTTLSSTRKTVIANLNSPNAELKEINSSDPGVNEGDTEHTGMTQAPMVHEYIGCVLAPWKQDIQNCILLMGELAL